MTDAAAIWTNWAGDQSCSPELIARPTSEDELGPQLAERGLALQKQGDIDRQSVSGAVATATHGTGVRFPNISARVSALRLVTALGQAPLPNRRDPARALSAVGSVPGGAGADRPRRCLPERLHPPGAWSRRRWNRGLNPA